MLRLCPLVSEHEPGALPNITPNDASAPVKRRRFPKSGFARLREAALATGMQPVVGLMGEEDHGPWRPLPGVKLHPASLRFLDALRHEQLRRGRWPFPVSFERTGKPGRPARVITIRRLMPDCFQKIGRPDATLAMVTSCAKRTRLPKAQAALIWALAICLEKSLVDQQRGRRKTATVIQLVNSAREEAARIVERMRGK